MEFQISILVWNSIIIFSFFSVEDFHHGEETNTVLYIPAGPDCAINRSYIEKAKECFLDGKRPPDFDRNCKASEEEFKDRATLEDLNDAARIMMGLDEIWF